MNLIVVQWIIIWILVSVLMVLYALLDNAKDDPLPHVDATAAKTNNQIDYSKSSVLKTRDEQA